MHDPIGGESRAGKPTMNCLKRSIKCTHLAFCRLPSILSSEPLLIELHPTTATTLSSSTRLPIKPISVPNKVRRQSWLLESGLHRNGNGAVNFTTNTRSVHSAAVDLWASHLIIPTGPTWKRQTSWLFCSTHRLLRLIQTPTVGVSPRNAPP